MFTLRNENIGEYIKVQQAKHGEKTCNVTNMTFLKCSKDNVVFNKNHAYWYQIQGQMHLTGNCVLEFEIFWF